MGTEGVRVVELVGAISLATDVGMGQPSGHAARTALRAVESARVLGLSDEEIGVVLYVALLRYLGCTADAAELAELTGDEIRLAQAVALTVMGEPTDRDVGVAVPGVKELKAASMRAHCEAAGLLAGRLPLPAGVAEAVRHGFERWDGAGHPGGLHENAIPVSVRIAVVARDVELWESQRGRVATQAMLTARRGRAYDPVVVDACREARPVPDCAGLADLVDAEPSPRWVAPDAVDQVLEVLADFADRKTPRSLGHSRRVAHLAEQAATALGLGALDARRLRWAGLVHDVGRAGVSAAVWNKRTDLTAEDWERVRMHPYHTERILTRCRPLVDLARLAGAHHERLDGSGYFRGSAAAALPVASRLLAVADAYVCAAEGDVSGAGGALQGTRAAAVLQAEAREHRLNRAAVSAVLDVAGHRPQRRPTSSPTGLTSREEGVLTLAAQGLTIAQMARRLGISPKTVDRHLQNSYAKIGVTSRAAAAVFALTHGLLPEGGEISR